MDMMEIRRALMQPHVKTIGGLPVLIDGYRYSPSDGPFDGAGTSDSDYFITGWFDSGSASTKRYSLQEDLQANNLTVRWFNDRSVTSVDYWRPNKSGIKNFSSAGIFIAATVYKPTAANYYLYNRDTGKYVFKGKNVT